MAIIWTILILISTVSPAFAGPETPFTGQPYQVPSFCEDALKGRSKAAVESCVAEVDRRYPNIHRITGSSWYIGSESDLAEAATIIRNTFVPQTGCANFLASYSKNTWYPSKTPERQKLAEACFGEFKGRGVGWGAAVAAAHWLSTGTPPKNFQLEEFQIKVRQGVAARFGGACNKFIDTDQPYVPSSRPHYMSDGSVMPKSTEYEVQDDIRACLYNIVAFHPVAWKKLVEWNYRLGIDHPTLVGGFSWDSESFPSPSQLKAAIEGKSIFPEFQGSRVESRPAPEPEKSPLIASPSVQPSAPPQIWTPPPSASNSPSQPAAQPSQSEKSSALERVKSGIGNVFTIALAGLVLLLAWSVLKRPLNSLWNQNKS